MEAIGGSSHVQAPGPGTAACGGTGGRASCLGDPKNPEVFAGVWCPRAPSGADAQGRCSVRHQEGSGGCCAPVCTPPGEARLAGTVLEAAFAAGCTRQSGRGLNLCWGAELCGVCGLAAGTCSTEPPSAELRLC